MKEKDEFEKESKELVGVTVIFVLCVVAIVLASGHDYILDVLNALSKFLRVSGV